MSRHQALSKSFPAKVLESLVENMSSTEPCYSQVGNEQMPVAMSSDTNYIAKHSSNLYNPSNTISSSISGPNTSFAKEIPSQGMSLHPRMVQDTLSKLYCFYIKELSYPFCLFHFLSEKQRIDSGYFDQAEVKSKKE